MWVCMDCMSWLPGQKALCVCMCTTMCFVSVCLCTHMAGIHTKRHTHCMRILYGCIGKHAATQMHTTVVMYVQHMHTHAYTHTCTCKHTYTYICMHTHSTNDVCITHAHTRKCVEVNAHEPCTLYVHPKG